MDRATIDARPGTPRSLAAWVPWLFAIDASFVALHFALGRDDFWNLDKEHNLPTWFSAAKLGWIGLAALAAFESERALLSRPFPPRLLWVLAAGFFFYLSLDDVTVIHEGVLRHEVRDLLPADSLWISLMPWQLVYGPFLFVAAIGLLGLFASRFSGSPRLQIAAIGGLTCWVGAVLLEGLAKPFFMVHGLYPLEVGLEEGLELAGASALLLAFTRYPGELETGRLEIADLRLESRVFVRATIAFVLSLAIGVAIVAAVSLRNSAWLYRHNGSQLAGRGKHAEAIAAYREAIARDPTDAASLAGIARAELALDRHEAAVASYERALGLRAGDARLWNGLGVALHELGRYADAEAAYRRAIEANAGYSRAIANLGLALELQDRTDEAKAEFRRALELDPNQRLARARLKRLDPPG